MSTDDFAAFKAAQRDAWSGFAPLEAVTTMPAAHLVRFAGIGEGDEVLDVACGTGPTSITAARTGARVTGLDLTPALLERARSNAALAGVSVSFVEGDAEALPFPDASFDVVISQFGHMFAPRPSVAVAEMLRVLRPGGWIAFSTWPPEHFVGRMFALSGRYLPPFPGAAAPPAWGDVQVVRERLGEAVDEVLFDRGTMLFPALSIPHYRAVLEVTGPVGKLAQILSPERLAEFRAEFEALVAPYFAGNAVKQEYLVTRGRKRAAAPG